MCVCTDLASRTAQNDGTKPTLISQMPAYPIISYVMFSAPDLIFRAEMFDFVYSTVHYASVYDHTRLAVCIARVDPMYSKNGL